jgi:hypothetical protein
VGADPTKDPTKDRTTRLDTDSNHFHPKFHLRPLLAFLPSGAERDPVASGNFGKMTHGRPAFVSGVTKGRMSCPAGIVGERAGEVSMPTKPVQDGQTKASSTRRRRPTHAKATKNEATRPSPQNGSANSNYFHRALPSGAEPDPEQIKGLRKFDPDRPTPPTRLGRFRPFPPCLSPPSCISALY